MIIYVLSFIIIALCILGLSLSLIYGRGAIKGSCRATEGLPGFEAGDGCSGACGTKQSDDAVECEHHHSCPNRQKTDH
jgi:hypothetical protein